MSDADATTLQAILDRQEIVDTLLRYASAIDAKDYPTLRGTLADDVVAQYGAAADPISGADTLTKWIEEMGADRLWQHHLLAVYHVDIDGDEARTLTYHTSRSAGEADPDEVLEIVARYRDVVRRVDGTWKIADKRMELCWMETRHFSQIAASDAERAQADEARAKATSDG
jgi:hypothetical protein